MKEGREEIDARITTSAMNLAQRIVLIFGFLVLFIAILFPPWLYIFQAPDSPQVERPAGYHLILGQHTPQDAKALSRLFSLQYLNPELEFFSMRIDHTRLMFEIVGVVLLTAFLYFQETDALEYLTLKGHLLVEKMLVRLGQLTLSEPEDLKFLKLKSFYARACVVRASVREICEDRHWDLILTLNQVRNDYAHELDPPKVEDKLSKLFQTDDDLYPKTDTASTIARAERLRLVIKHCIKFLLSHDPSK
jgi:hypothetical protein